MKTKIFCLCAALALPFFSIAQTDTLFVYGPGGPLSPFKECAVNFEKKNNVVVQVVGGPDNVWRDNAIQNGDLIFGGAEYMLTAFIAHNENLIEKSTRTSLYQRGAVILVRPGNPKNILEIKDLCKKGVRIMDVNGAGQLGMWEDIAGKQNLISCMAKNIIRSFPNTALAIADWKSNPDYDAWITYSSWNKNLDKLTEAVKIPSDLQLYRGTPIVMTKKGYKSRMANAFIQYLKSDDAHCIFQKWGWE